MSHDAGIAIAFVVLESERRVTPASSGCRARPFREAVIDLAAITRERAHDRRPRRARPSVMAVVKANAYGHGAVPAARAALAGGATGSASPTSTRRSSCAPPGIDAPVLAWLHDPDADFARPSRAGVDSASRTSSSSSARHPRSRGRPRARAPQGRHGPQPQRRRPRRTGPRVVAPGGRARARRAASSCAASSATSPTRRATADAAQRRGLRARRSRRPPPPGSRPRLRHLASTEQAIRDPQARYDIVRIGIGIYGLSPFGDGTTCTEPRPDARR